MNGPAHCTISDDGLVHDVTYVLWDKGTPEPKPLLLMVSPMLTAASSRNKRFYTIKNQSGEVIGILTEKNVLIRGEDLYRLEKVDDKITFECCRTGERTHRRFGRGVLERKRQ